MCRDIYIVVKNKRLQTQGDFKVNRRSALRGQRPLGLWTLSFPPRNNKTTLAPPPCSASRAPSFILCSRNRTRDPVFTGLPNISHPSSSPLRRLSSPAAGNRLFLKCDVWAPSHGDYSESLLVISSQHNNFSFVAWLSFDRSGFAAVRFKALPLPSLCSDWRSCLFCLC